MIIGERLRELREEKKLSQGDIEKRTGLLRCYISRVETSPLAKNGPPSLCRIDPPERRLTEDRARS